MHHPGQHQVVRVERVPGELGRAIHLPIPPANNSEPLHEFSELFRRHGGLHLPLAQILWPHVAASFTAGPPLVARRSSLVGSEARRSSLLAFMREAASWTASKILV